MQDCSWKREPSNEANADCLDSLEGSLMKRSGSTLAQAVRLGGYSTRFVRVRNGWLTYYKDGQDGEKGSINLAANTCYVSPDPLSSTRFTLAAAGGTWKDCNFTGADSGRVFHFDARDSEYGRTTWMNVIRDQASPTLCRALSGNPSQTSCAGLHCPDMADKVDADSPKPSPKVELPTLLRQPPSPTKASLPKVDDLTKAGDAGSNRIGRRNANLSKRLPPSPLVQEAINRHVCALHAADVPQRYHAAEALAALKSDAHTARPALEKALLNDPNVHVRKSVARALGDIGDEAAEDVLWRCFQQDTDKFVRERAEQALNALIPGYVEARAGFSL